MDLMTTRRFRARRAPLPESSAQITLKPPPCTGIALRYALRLTVLAQTHAVSWAETSVSGPQLLACLVLHMGNQSFTMFNNFR
ncbi:MAG: hypothetical protein U1D25_18455 [Hydrogenophaga sp.]|uniref:hypothetical protein n=1 Tax=Hydrogenophaga sp. TaxID=1904254 RepID=UPI0027484590|nr:hypothetical protein [Hydrogenophaga sp.]MDP2419015.1 hypothetical protein [Hydrogenophaga sp.]MDZ4190068.1 hypothetical protein [Hydrogenophaga sp.]